jgi:hypothetical protein
MPRSGSQTNFVCAFQSASESDEPHSRDAAQEIAAVGWGAGVLAPTDKCTKFDQWTTDETENDLERLMPLSCLASIRKDLRAMQAMRPRAPSKTRGPARQEPPQRSAGRCRTVGAKRSKKG